MLPVASDTIELLRSGDDDVSLIEFVDVRSKVACQFDYLFVQKLTKTVFPVFDSFSCESFQRSDVYRFFIHIFLKS